MAIKIPNHIKHLMGYKTDRIQDPVPVLRNDLLCDGVLFALTCPRPFYIVHTVHELQRIMTEFSGTISSCSIVKL